MSVVQKYAFQLLKTLLICLLLPYSLSGQEHATDPDGGSRQKRFEWSSYLQLRYTGIDDGADLYALRRFKVILSGRVKPHVEYRFQGIFKDGNHSNTDGRPYVQEAWVKYTAWKHAHLTMGQFKPPFGMERLTPDWQLATLDRSIATDHLVPDGQLGGSFARDRGLQLDAWLAANRLYYAAAVFDGNGANVRFRGNGPLVVGRLVGVLYKAPSQGSRQDRITLGGAVLTRNDHQQDFTQTLPGTADLGYAQFSGRDTRLNLEASADFDPVNVRSEYFYAWFNPDRAPLPEVQASGFYVQSGVRFWRTLQGVAKYEGFDPNRAVRNRNGLRWTTLGLNWFIRENRIRLGANYIFKQEAQNGFPNNGLLVQFQFFLH